MESQCLKIALILALHGLVTAEYGCHYFRNNDGLIQCNNNTLEDFIQFKQKFKPENFSYLKLTHCKLKDLPAGVLGTGWDSSNDSAIQQNLRNVDLSYNQICDITKYAFYGLKNVVLLNLKVNQIEFIQSDHFLGLHQSLVILDLSYNKLTRLGLNIFSDFLSLRVLYLNNNQIKYLDPNFLYRVGNLIEVLSLSHNNLPLISDTITKSLFKVQSLDLSHNHLQEFNFVFINDSHIDYTKDFIPLGQLESLFLDNNKLFDFNIEKIMYLPNLRLIKIQDNQFMCNRQEIILKDLINIKINVTTLELEHSPLSCVDKQSLVNNDEGLSPFVRYTNAMKMSLEFLAAFMLVLIPTIVIVALVKFIYYRIDKCEQIELQPL